MSYEETLEKVILRLDREEKEKDKRIAELEKEKAIGVYHFTVEEYKAHNLEQQAKGVEDCIKETANDKYRISLRDTLDLYNYANELRSQAKLLKSKVK
jgi:hypothetical protein